MKDEGHELSYPGHDKWMTTEEAAKYSGYDVEHVRRLARQGKIGAVKRGRDWWIEVEVFMAYLESMIDSEDKRAGPKGEPASGAIHHILPSSDKQE